MTLDAFETPEAPGNSVNFQGSAQVSAESLLERARIDAAARGLPFSGSVTPTQAWQIFSNADALLVDVRSAEELKFVGRVPRAIHVPWATGTSLNRNPRFVKELEAKTKGKDAVVLLLCRSGNRSALAAEAAHKAGFSNVFNISEGFEGDLDERLHRGAHNGWRHHGLPWEQD